MHQQPIHKLLRQLVSLLLGLTQKCFETLQWHYRGVFRTLSNEMELFAKIVNGWCFYLRCLTRFWKRSLHCVCQLVILEVQTRFLKITLLVWDIIGLLKKNWTNKGKGDEIIADPIIVFNSSSTEAQHRVCMFRQ